MGLFDKLKNIMNTSSDAGDPLQDEIVKKYYDIIYDMRMSRGWFGEEIAAGNCRAKKYVELVLGEACDQDRLAKAVEAMNMSNSDHPSTKLEKQLVDYRKSLYQEYKARDYKSAYGIDIKAACEACYGELLAEVKSKYEAMLNATVDDDSCESFDDGISKYILNQYRGTQDSSVVKDCICVAMMDSFFEGNETTKEIVFGLLESEEAESISETMDPEAIATVVCDFVHR